MKTVLFVGGLDSSGGAGLLRDCAAAAEFGVRTKIAATAVTAQTDGALSALYPVPGPVVARQIEAAGAVDAVKVGMLSMAGVVSALDGALSRYAGPVVLDPVLAASSGASLLTLGGIALLVERVLPRVTLLTPNRPELAVLASALGVSGAAEAEIVAAIMARGTAAVLVKGGHDSTPARCEDRLYLRASADPLRFEGPRHPLSLRGTGCHLASAIASALALGADLPEAVRQGRASLERRFRTEMASRAA
ncbi:PfkB family carbohydrate kinase [Paenirhodobacter enshiensis]|uniref:PfkB family carbohydrate kinase n=1 Tax=Paenirhodobacter enshiensis TaxID=1105367 RepID=UPI0005693D64|nr:PfkB family carbohydrate kinase [Paenirhodobacter enshiensis]